MAATNNLGPQWQPVPLVGHGKSLPWDPQGQAHGEGPNGELVEATTLFDHHLRPNWSTPQALVSDTTPSQGDVTREDFRTVRDAIEAPGIAEGRITYKGEEAKGRTPEESLAIQTAKKVQGVKDYKGDWSGPEAMAAKAALYEATDERKYRESVTGKNMWRDSATGENRTLRAEVMQNGIHNPIALAPPNRGDAGTYRYSRFNGNHRFAIVKNALANDPESAPAQQTYVPLYHKDPGTPVPLWESTPGGKLTLSGGVHPDERINAKKGNIPLIGD